MSENTEKKTFDINGFMAGTAGKAICIVSILAAIVSAGFAGFDTYSIAKEEGSKDAIALSEDGEYNSMEDVSAYIHKYEHLPDNYITKKEAQNLGWIGGSVSDVAPGMAIGGDRFYADYAQSDDIALAEGRYYTECDVDTDGAPDRGRERLIFSNDGLIYYTADHYETFELLYGQEVLNELN